MRTGLPNCSREKLGVEVQYEFFPTRIGFIRNTLRAESESGPGYKCDLVMNVSEHFELAMPTDPYYTSTHALVLANGRGMDDVSSPEMLFELIKSGLDVTFGVTDRGPDQFWVFKHGLMGNIKPYQSQTGDPEVHPGETLTKDLLAGTIDAAIVWGPTIGILCQNPRRRPGSYHPAVTRRFYASPGEV